MKNQYDQLIKNASDDYLPGIDWRLLKAQLMAESGLNPNAKSPVGAQGIAQFMPGTWDQIAKEMNLPDHANPYQPERAIPAAAYYMRKLWDTWTTEREQTDRYFLALASYNAGLGNILKAQKKADMATEYKPIAAHLHQVTGEDNSNETISYVRRIYGFYGGMLM